MLYLYTSSSIIIKIFSTKVMRFFSLKSLHVLLDSEIHGINTLLKNKH